MRSYFIVWPNIRRKAVPRGPYTIWLWGKDHAANSYHFLWIGGDCLQVDAQGLAN